MHALKLDRISIQLLEHRESGLLMACSKDVRGFIVYARTEHEMRNKLMGTFRAYMDAIGEPLHSEWTLVDESLPGCWPPTFVLHQKAAS